MLSAIREHAEKSYPRECCGLIIATGRRFRYIPCTNKAATPGEHFVISAAEYASAEDSGVVVAVVHSHPDGPATASDADRVMCEVSGMPWHIVSVGKTGDAAEVGDIETIIPSGYEAPLIGRQFSHGILDCYTLVRDFYSRELGVQLSQYERADHWWQHGANLYMDNIECEGFTPVAGDLTRGDLILMQVRSPVVNHAGIYLGDGTMLHHLYGRLSERVVYGGHWAEMTRTIVRHREVSDA